MSIRREELNLVKEEKKLLAQRVFLEKSYKPTSMTGNGIPQGMLMLTNKRLFFFTKGQGKSKSNLVLREVVPGVVASVLPFGETTRTVIELAERGVSTLIERLEYNDKIEGFLNDESSFAIPLQKIISCEKFGKISDQLVGLFAFKKRYLRIGVEDANGEKVYCCIYSTNPKSPLDYRRTINHKKWYKEIMAARAQAIDRL
jgi:hypothetical protein